MRKVGNVCLKLAGNLFRAFIAYYTDDMQITRFDVFKELGSYDILNTENCVAAYYKDTKEYRLGNEEIITRILTVVNTISLTPGVTERETDFTNGVITFNNTKKCKDGSVYKYTTVNGVVTEESFLTDNDYINFTAVDGTDNNVLSPMNLALYDVVGDLGMMLSGDSDELEYYTEEQLRSVYGQKMDHIYSYDFRVAQSLEEAFDWLDAFRQTDSKLVAIDIESTGLDVDMFGQDCITSVGIAFNKEGSMMFPFRQKGCQYNLPIWFFSEIAEAVNTLPDTTRVGTFNGKMEIKSFWKERPEYLKYSDKASEWESSEFDMRNKNIVYETKYVPTDRVMNRLQICSSYLRYKENPSTVNHGINIRSDVDGFHISMKIDQRRGAGIHTLKTITSRITGLFWLELDNIFKGKIKFDVLPPNLIKLYAGADPCNTIRVIEYLEAELPRKMRAVTELEHHLTYVKSENEFYGMRTDIGLLNKSIAELTYVKTELERRIREIHKTDKNIRSNNVKQEMFYNQLHAPVSIVTDTGKPSTSVLALNTILEYGEFPKDKRVKGIPDMAIFVDKNGFKVQEPKTDEEKDNVDKVLILSGEDLGSNRYPSLLMFKKYSAVCKELGALNRIKERSHNGRVIFYIISDGAESDRQTSDAHQYSDTMKKMILSDSEDHYLISCDYTQVELRVLAYLTGQQNLIELEKNPEIDVHRAILSIITGKPIYLISDEERKVGKSTNFGVVYGMTAFGLVKRNVGIHYTKEDLEKCIKSITDFYNGMPAVKRFCNESEEIVLKQHAISTEFGYIRRFDQLDDPAITKKMKSKVIKGANNTRIQGFAATMMKIAEVNYYNYIREKGWNELVDCNGVMLPKVRMMLSIHDEVLISAHKSIPVAEIIEMCKVCQELKIKGAPPFFASPAFVTNWYAGKSAKYEIPILFRDKIIEEYHKGNNILDMSRYVDVLAEYREGVLRDYMNGLISKYKTVDEVTAHVTDDNLTHVLISVYIKDNERKMEHEDKIRLAVERYMEGHDMFIEEDDTNEDTDNGYFGEDEEIGKYVYYNDRGEQIVEYVDDETKEEIEEDEHDDEVEEVMHKAVVQDSYAIYTLDACMVDMTEVKKMLKGDEVHDKLMNLTDSDKGDYRLIYIIGSNVVDTKRKINYIPNDIDTIIQKALLEKEGA